MQQETNSHRPGYEKIVSHGRVWAERLNSKELPFSFVPTSTLLILSGVMLISALAMVVPYSKATDKILGYFAKTDIAAKTGSSPTFIPTIYFGMDSSMRAVEQPEELKADVAQAVIALETGNAVPFTSFPTNVGRGTYDVSKFSLKKVNETTAFLAIPVAHFMKFTDQSVQPPVTKYRLQDGSYTDSVSPDAVKAKADSLFLAALHKENGKWQVYNFIPAQPMMPLEKVSNFPDVTQQMLKKSFEAAFVPAIKETK